MVITCSRIFNFDAAHRVKDHESKCKHLHGHRFLVEATFATDLGLDAVGRIIDFGVLKETLGKWIDDNLDHSTILFSEDQQLGKSISEYTGQDIFYLPYNPTAENIAHYLFTEVCPKLFSGNVKCIKIKIHETPNCYSEISDTSVPS